MGVKAGSCLEQLSYQATPEGLKVVPSLLREGKKYKSRLLQWHRWAKDSGASDIKALGKCRDIPAWVREESRFGLKILNPIGPFQKWKMVGMEIPERQISQR